MGTQDEAAGVGNFLNNLVTAPLTDAEFDPIRAYQIGKVRTLQRLEATREQLGALGTVSELAGAIAGADFRSILAAPTRLGRVKQSGWVGGRAGALGGWGYGDGRVDSVQGAISGAITGATTGMLLPLAGYGGQLIGSARRTRQLERDIAKAATDRLGQSNTQAQQRYFQQPDTGIGHHVKPVAEAKKEGWPRAKIDSPLNVFQGGTRAEQSVRHALSDRNFWGGGIPEPYGGGSWRIKSLGVTKDNKYDDLEQRIFANPKEQNRILRTAIANGNAIAALYWYNKLRERAPE